ncbi:MAG: hypothetical protein Alpg2KO_30310 [Alphaproteobacteria bacterium]
MDRALLTYLLTSGPSRKLDVFAGSIQIDPDLRNFDELLFNTTLMNRAILFKYTEPNVEIDPLAPDRVPTLVFLPYETERPELGGESFFFNKKNFDEFFANKTDGHEGMQQRLDKDLVILEALSELPTLSPYLISEQLKRYRLEMPDVYLEMPYELKRRIRHRLRERLHPLVAAAFKNTNLDVRMALDEFVNLVIDADDLPGLMPLAAALRLRPEHALTSFSAWSGITYFEDEFNGLQSGLAEMTQWLTKFPLPAENLPREMKVQMAKQADGLRKNLRADWKYSQEMLGNFSQAYDTLLVNQDPRPFSEFLNEAPRLYWEFGDILGRLEQLIFCWRQRAGQFKFEHMPYEQLEEFYYLTSRTYNSAVSQSNRPAA